MVKKKLFILLLIVLILWLLMGTVDFLRVNSFEKPIFCIVTDGADDGGSGHYQGLGYAFTLEGNFMPEAELPGVTKYTYQIFGFQIKTGYRD